MALPFSQLDQPGPSVDPPSASTALRLRSEENEGKGRECGDLPDASLGRWAVLEGAVRL